VLATSAIASLKLPNDIMPLKTFWRFSLFSAVLTRLLASQLKIPKSERLFVIGLLYEIGHLVLYAKHPELAKRAMELSRNNQEMLYISEQKLLGMHYGEIGAKLMAQWHLPAHFQDIVHYQPTPDLAPEQVRETALLHLVRACAEKSIFGHMSPIEQSVSRDIWDILQLNPEQLDDTVEQALKAATEMEKLMFN